MSSHTPRDLTILHEETKDSPSDRFIAQDAMKKAQFDPIAEMMELYGDLKRIDKDLDNPVHSGMRMKILLGLSKFWAPQPKSIDINVATSERSIVQVIDFTNHIETRRAYMPQITPTYNAPMLGVTEEVEVYPNE
jgi:hypothetical protein